MSNRLFFLFILSVFLIPKGITQTWLGSIIDNTNPGLPESYQFREYVFPEPDDEGNCTGKTNNDVTIEGIFFAQTHRLSVDHEFFFLIGDRPALLQLALTGEGDAPDVTVEGILNGHSLGIKCLKGGETLQNAIDLNIANFENYYSVTIPRAWMKDGLELTLTAGNVNISLTPEELQIGIPTELNLLVFDMDFLDYNFEEHRTPIIDNFLQEIASAIPASIIRLGRFPETIRYPEVASSAQGEQLVRVRSKNEIFRQGVPDIGNINALASSSLANMHRSSHDYMTTFYFGNTLNLDPGGWGGGKSFVSFDYHDVTIHELGHALSLSHWADEYRPVENRFQFEYPYAGESGSGDGRGHSWNFIQGIYEFIDPTCEADDSRIGLERSDAMQRNFTCLEKRSYGNGPWDGFGDYSALAMHRYMVGDYEKSGMVRYQEEMVPYQFPVQSGFPNMKINNGIRTYQRHPSQQNEFLQVEEYAPLPGEEKLNQDVYLVYGTAHETQSQGNIVYQPIKFNGTLPPVYDPTDPDIMQLLKTDRIFLDRLGGAKDITLKLSYADGSVLHAINPYHSYERGPWKGDVGAFRYDLCMWSLIVPGDKELIRVELYNRPLIARGINENIRGNIMNPDLNITAENFMDQATFQAEYVQGQSKVPGLNAIGNRVWNDLNRNGIDDEGEPGIEGVKILLWADSDDDGIPDSEGFSGSTETDTNGNYKFFGLAQGKYICFVWFLENFDEGGPLHGMLPVEEFVDPNTDIDLDNNGRSGEGVFPGLGAMDFASGIIELTAEGEPLNDGDWVDDWYNYDISGNMTIDFGFFDPNYTYTKENPSRNIIISPNPFQETITIRHLDNNVAGVAEIWDITGRKIMTFSLPENDQSLTTGGLYPGIYILRIKDKNGTLFHTQKIIKQ